MQADHFENFLEPELAKYNYAGLYKCKTREYMGQYGKMDGCAIFYRRDKFSIAQGGVSEVEFNTIARQRHSSDKRLLNRLLKDNIAQASCSSLPPRYPPPFGLLRIYPINLFPMFHTPSTYILGQRSVSSRLQIVLFEMHVPHPAPRRQLLIANTHINASPEFADVKLWQSQVLTIFVTLSP